MSKESFYDFTIRVKVDDYSDFDKKKFERDLKEFAAKMLGETCWEYTTFGIFVDPMDKTEEFEQFRREHI